MDIIKKIAIIGAGPAGLVTAKHLGLTGMFDRIDVFEQRDSVGGIWNFSLDSVADSNNQHPMYEDLETNIPHFMMQFSGQSYPNQTQLFPTRAMVQEYLERYAQQLWSPTKHLHLQHSVTNLRTSRCEEPGKWQLQIKDLASNSASVWAFDAVVVASGQQYVSYIPELEGLDDWEAQNPGTVLHSRNFRSPEAFIDKKVVVVGNSASGLDISRRIASVCRKPLLISQRSESSFFFKLPGSRLLPSLAKLEPLTRSVHFDDGTTEEDIDLIILCTGYDHSYPFLSSELLQDCEKTDFVPGNSSVVQHLYQYIFQYQHPTLTFCGIPTKALPFSIAEAQAVVIAHALSGRLALPEKAVMLKWIAENLNSTDRPLRATKLLALKSPIDLDYTNALLEWAMEAYSQTDVGINNGPQPEETPSPWDSKAYWVRKNIPDMKRAFDNLGDKRHKVINMEMLGYYYTGQENCMSTN